MGLTRTHFIEIAGALREARPGAEAPPLVWDVWARCVVKIADVLGRKNPTFDRELFVKNCKGE